MVWGIPGIKEAAGDVAGLWSGVWCPDETCTPSLRVPTLYSGSRTIIGQVAFFFIFFPFQLTLLALALGRNQPEKCLFPASLGRRRGWLVYCSETLLEATLPLPPTSPRVYCSLDIHPSPDGVAASIIGVICLLESHCRNSRGGDQRCRAVALNFLESRLLLSWPGRLDRRPGTWSHL